MMRRNSENTCEQHPDRDDCPDCLITKSDFSGSYGLIIHDGSRSMIEISYCPWCGAKLPDAPL
jgi:hypothetical protein